MIFQSPKALKYLLEEGDVYTFRVHSRKSLKKDDWITDKRGGHKISDATIEFVTVIDRLSGLSSYVSRSGFESLTDWFNEIKRLNPNDIAAQANIISGYLYHVTKKEKNSKFLKAMLNDEVISFGEIEIDKQKETK